MKCVNEKCKKDPLKSLNFRVVNIDGDLACCSECEKEYKKQRDNFLNNINDDNFYFNWLNGKN